MCVCVCAHRCTGTLTSVSARRVSSVLHEPLRLYTHTYTRTHTHTLTHTSLCAYTHIHTRTHTLTHTSLCAYTHIHTHTHTLTHTHQVCCTRLCVYTQADFKKSAFGRVKGNSAASEIRYDAIVISSSSQVLDMCRVGQNHIYTVYIRYFWQGNYQIYGHTRCVYTVLANLRYVHSWELHF